jgi:hypothetical protein
MIAADNIQQFANLLDKHLYFLRAGINEGYDNKFTRHAQIYVIIKMFLVDYFNNGIHDNNEVLAKLKDYHSTLLNDKNGFKNLTEELQAIEFLLSLEPIEDLRRN